MQKAEFCSLRCLLSNLRLLLVTDIAYGIVMYCITPEYITHYRMFWQAEVERLNELKLGI